MAIDQRPGSTTSTFRAIDIDVEGIAPRRQSLIEAEENKVSLSRRNGEKIIVDPIDFGGKGRSYRGSIHFPNWVLPSQVDDQKMHVGEDRQFATILMQRQAGTGSCQFDRSP
jgi:hypothetical protein